MRHTGWHSPRRVAAEGSTPLPETAQGGTRRSGWHSPLWVALAALGGTRRTGWHWLCQCGHNVRPRCQKLLWVALAAASAGRSVENGVYANWRIRRLARRLLANIRVERLFFLVRLDAMASEKNKNKKPISRPLRAAIRKLGLTAYTAAKRAGVSVDAVQRFLNAERSLRLTTVDKLATALRLTLCPDEPPPVDRRRSSP